MINDGFDPQYILNKKKLQTNDSNDGKIHQYKHYNILMMAISDIIKCQAERS